MHLWMFISVPCLLKQSMDQPWYQQQATDQSLGKDEGSCCKKVIEMRFLVEESISSCRLPQSKLFCRYIYISKRCNWCNGIKWMNNINAAIFTVHKIWSTKKYRFQIPGPLSKFQRLVWSYLRMYLNYSIAKACHYKRHTIIWSYREKNVNFFPLLHLNVSYIILLNWIKFQQQRPIHFDMSKFDRPLPPL